MLSPAQVTWKLLTLCRSLCCMLHALAESTRLDASSDVKKPSDAGQGTQMPTGGRFGMCSTTEFTLKLVHGLCRVGESDPGAAPPDQLH